MCGENFWAELLSLRRKKTKRDRWTELEVKYLKQGVQKHPKDEEGTYKWRKILDDNELHFNPWVNRARGRGWVSDEK